MEKRGNGKGRLRRRIALLLCSVCFLAGCTAVSRSTVVSQTEEAVDRAVHASISSSTNINKGFLSYYLEPSVGRRESTKTSSVFLINGVSVVLNVDVASVITAKYYSMDEAVSYPDGFRDVDAFPGEAAEKEGSFLSGSGLIREYRMRIYRVTDMEYGILLQTSNLIMTAECPYGELPDVAYKMMKILRTCRVDEEKVVTAYSQKELINYTKETLDIFRRIYPESGTLQDMLDSGQDEENQTIQEGN